MNLSVLAVRGVIIIAIHSFIHSRAIQCVYTLKPILAAPTLISWLWETCLAPLMELVVQGDRQTLWWQPRVTAMLGEAQSTVRGGRHGCRLKNQGKLP